MKLFNDPCFFGPSADSMDPVKAGAHLSADTSVDPREFPFHDVDVIHSELTASLEARSMRRMLHRRAQSRGIRAAYEEHSLLGDPIGCAAPCDASFSAANRCAAELALRRVRDAFKLRCNGTSKTTNKWSAGKAEPINRPMTARLSFRFPPERQSPRLRFSFVSIGVWQGSVPNCAGQSIAAQDFLSERSPELQTSFATLRGDHGMTIVGTVDPRLMDLPLTGWPSHLFICDPWANISCAVPDYPSRFREKMRQWEQEGKRLLLDGQWSSPLSLEWLAVADGLQSLWVRTNFSSGQCDHEEFSPSGGLTQAL